MAAGIDQSATGPAGPAAGEDGAPTFGSAPTNNRLNKKGSRNSEHRAMGDDLARVRRANPLQPVDEITTADVLAVLTPIWNN